MGSSTPVDLTLEDIVDDANLLAHYRRLSHAPLNVQVNWQAFEKVAVLYDPAKEAELARRCEALLDFACAANRSGR